MKRKQWSQRLRHVVLMCAAAIGLTAFGDDYFWSGTATSWSDEGAWTTKSANTSNYVINKDATITVAGAQSVSTGLFIENAIATIQCDAGSSLHLNSVYVGTGLGDGALTLKGSGTYTTGDCINLSVWDNGVGSLTIDGASVAAPSWIRLGLYNTKVEKSAALTIKNGGSLSLWHIQSYLNGASTITLDGGSLIYYGTEKLGNNWEAGEATVYGSDGKTWQPVEQTVVIESAGGTISVPENATVTVTATVKGAGTLTKIGSGTLVATGDMSGFIGKVAVENGAGSVTLPATAKHARVGDYTAKTTNGDGTFTFSYDATGSAATTATATLLSLDFEDDSYDEDVSGWSLSGNGGSEQGERILTNGTASKFLHLWTGTGSGVRQYKGTCTLPSDVVNSDNYAIEFDWFAARQNDIHITEDRDLGLFIYAGSEELVRVVSNISKLSGNSAQIYLKDSLSETTIATASRGARCDGTNNQDYWYHVIIKSNNENGLTFKLVAADGTTSFAETRVCDHVNITSIVVDLNRSRDKVTGSGNTPAYSGIDDLLATTPAVAAVDNTPYATFASAVAAATSSSTITLYSDVALTSSVELPYGATLDLNGYALYTTDSDVAVIFNDGVHCLESTTAGGYKTFSNVVAVPDAVYVWTGDADDNLWATLGNWSVGGTTPESLPAADSTVLIPAGDGTELTIKCSTDAYTGYLTIQRDVTLTRVSTNEKGGTTDEGIRMSKVSGTRTLTLKGSTSPANWHYSFCIFPASTSLSTLVVDCDLRVTGNVYLAYILESSRAISLYGKLLGDGTITCNNYKEQPGFLFYGDTTQFAGQYYGGSRNSWDRDGTRFYGTSSLGSADAYWKFGVEKNSGGEIGWPLNVAGEYEFGRLDAPYFRAHASGITVKVGNLAGTSTINGKLEYAANKIVKVGASSTLDLTLSESVGAVEAEAGTLNLKGTVAPATMTITGADATVTVEEGNPAVPVLAGSLTDGYKIVSTAGEGFKTYKAGANCTITWKVDGCEDEVVSSAVGAVVSHADAVRDGYEFDRWEPAVVSPATGDVTYTAIWKTADVTVAKPVVSYGADYTRATVTAEVKVTTPGDVTYELTVTKGTTTQTYTGTVSDGTVTFADVAVPREAADIYADITYTVTPKAGTAALASAATTEAPTTKSEWAFSSTVSDGKVANNGGSWTAGAPTVAENKLAINDATFTAGTKSADDIVVITMEDVIFGDTNDAEITGAQAGIRIGESGKFQVLTTNNAWQETSVVANGKTEYDVVVTINYATKKYSVKVGTDTFDNISLAGSETGVNAIEFNGSGSLASLAGEAYDGNMVVDKNGKKYATVDAAIAALKAGTATAPLKMLHDGTAPAGWTIDENGVLTQAGIEVESEADKTLVAVPQGCTSIDTLIDLSNRYADDQIQAYDSKTGKFNTWKLSSEKVWTGVGRQDQDDAQPVFPTEADKVLKAGQAVWVLRMTKESKAAPIRLNASYADAPATVALETGWNLVAPTVDVEDLNSLNIVAAATDRIVVPSANGGAPAELKYKNGKWGYNTAEQDESGHWVLKFETEGITIPAGTGFWYVSDSDKNISL